MNSEPLATCVLKKKSCHKQNSKSKQTGPRKQDPLEPLAKMAPLSCLLSPFSLSPFLSFLLTKSRSRTKTLVDTRAPASRQTWAAARSNKIPLLPSTPALRMLLDGVQECQVGGDIGKCESTREWEAKAAAEKKAERLRVDPRVAGGGKGCEGSRRQRTVLGPQQGFVDFCQLQAELGDECLIERSSCSLLPSPLRLSWLSYNLCLRREVHRQSIPRGGGAWNPAFTRISDTPCLLTRPDCSQTGCWITLQPQHQCVCDGGTTSPYHPEAISPTCPCAAALPRTTLAKPNPINRNGKKAMV